jgi:Ser/Thr protein kinase RdoA (MazF antagonist)
MATKAPYAGLTPDAVLDAIESLGLRCDGRLLALNSYENRVYQIGIEDALPVVAKFYRPNRWSDAAILEEHGLVAELAAAEVPAVPALKFGASTLHKHGSFRFAVFPRQGGRSPELDQPGVREWLGRFIGRIHAIGGRSPFRDRPVLDIESFGDASRDYLLEHDFIPDDLLAAWESVTDQALDAVHDSFQRAGDVALLRLHGDCHLGNVLWTDDGPHFVDFDDARMGPAMQDLWMLISGDRAQMAQQLGELLDGYEQFMDFDRRQLHLLEALRTLRLIHYCAWIARRWQDPAFPAAFTWFNTQRYWQDRILELREQLALMDEPPLVV